MNNLRNKVIILGSGGHASVIANIFECLKFDEILIMDQTFESSLLKIDLTIDKRDQYKKTHLFFVAIGNNKDRKRWSQQLYSEGFELSTAIHPSAVVATNADIRLGSCVMAQAVIQPYAVIEEGVIINTSASVDHHSNIGAYTHVAPGATIAGSVHIGQEVLVGVGATIINNLRVTDQVIIGAGAVVVKSILESGTYVGVPAKKIN
jgi:sugar O-acyltransferase (sialic acid O-acetyltransferase NeuD family)